MHNIFRKGSKDYYVIIEILYFILTKASDFVGHFLLFLI